MSEPIQSISQGNYILATQQEVSHDNTLSGNGTSASPLGVVNGYNETVLWSGYSTSSAPGFDLADDISAFSYIDFYAVDDDGWCGYTRVGSDYCTTANRIPTTIGHFGMGNKNYVTRGIYVHPTSNTHLDSKSFGFDYVNNCTENDKTHMTKIVGINRK